MDGWLGILRPESGPGDMKLSHKHAGPTCGVSRPANRICITPLHPAHVGRQANSVSQLMGLGQVRAQCISVVRLHIGRSARFSRQNIGVGGGLPCGWVVREAVFWDIVVG